MIKKTLIYFILILFSTNVAAAELIMKCGEYTYKYIEDSAGDRVDYKHPKGTKNKYKEWCPEKRDMDISREGYSRIIKNHKERQILFNEFIKSSNEVGGIHLHGRELHLTTKWAKKYYDKETEKIDGN